MTEKECLCTTPEITIELNQQGPPGQQGLPGTDGFSPQITVAQQSDTSYVLTILTSEGQFNTPNLQGAGVPSNGIYGQYLMSNGGSGAQWVDFPVATEGSQGIISIADSDDLESNDNTSAITPAILNNKVQPATPTTQGLVHPNNPLYISPTTSGELFIQEANVGQQGTVQYGLRQSDVTNMSFLGLDDNRPGPGEAKLNGVWLPVAKTNVLGGVKPDGSTITATADGTISATASGGTSDYTELTNKPKINSVELSGDVPLNNLDLYSQTEINNALGQKQDKLATQAPLKVSSVTTTNQTNCTYIDGTATALGTATSTGTCSYTDYLGENRMSVSGYNSTTDGVHINYPFSIASSAESALCYPLSYVYGYYNEDGKFVFLLTTTKRRENQTYYYSYSIANNDLLVVNGSSKFITDIIDLDATTTQTSWSTLNYSKIYCPDGLNIGNNLHIDFLQLTDDGTFTVFNQRTVTLTDALITQLSKINIATYNISTNTEGETRTISPIRDASGNIVFNGDTGGSITSNTLQLEISSQANNILEVETDGLYVPSQSYTLPIATTSALGGVKIGNNLSITSDGVLSATTGQYTLPQATATELGGVKANEVTATDTQEVRINTTTGMLYTAPGLPNIIDGGNAQGGN